MKRQILILALILFSVQYSAVANIPVNTATTNPHDSLLVVVPNVFTPNSDGVNDTWSINVQGYGIAILELQTTIYNRWGEEIFQTTNIRAVWSGHNPVGKPCDSGSYFYVISYINGATNEQITLKGFIELIR